MTEAKKLYKGEVVAAQVLVDRKGSMPAPIQSVETSDLPSSFVCLKAEASPYYNGKVLISYYDAKSKVKSYREVLPDVKINVLSGRFGKELLVDYDKTKVYHIGDWGRGLPCSLGCDPEVFAVEKSGRVVPAWTYLPAKEKPLEYALHGQVGAVYYDGFQAEFALKNGHGCLAFMCDTVRGGLETIHQEAKKVGAQLTIKSVVPVDPDFLQKESEEHVQFGCAPSLNVYGIKTDLRNGRDVPYRFAGGHMHFGIAKENAKYIEKYIKGLDMILGVASVSLLGFLDDTIRRKFYGLPGEYRTPSHGFEYRTLSNAWLCHPLATNMVFDLGRVACGLAQDDFLNLWDCKEEETIDIILSNNIDKARGILTKNKDIFLQILKLSHCNEAVEYPVWLNGIDSVLKDPTDIVHNWGLDGGWVTHCDGTNKNWSYAARNIQAGKKF